MINLVTFDMDGTVLDSESRLAASAVEAIAALVARSIPTASVSGRSIRRSLEPFVEHPELVRSLYMGGYNGAVVVGPEVEAVSPRDDVEVVLGVVGVGVGGAGPLA